MIADSLENSSTYTHLHPLFPKAFQFLKTLSPQSLTPGRMEIDGDALYVMVVKTDGKTHSGAVLESHKKYIDIQYQISGTDSIGWLPKSGIPSDGYIEKNDCDIHRCGTDNWVNTQPGSFAIFFPHDAHAPLGGIGAQFKAVVKVRVD